VQTRNTSAPGDALQARRSARGSRSDVSQGWSRTYQSDPTFAWSDPTDSDGSDGWTGFERAYEAGPPAVGRV